ncbi:hypothetical protein B0H13DRAFT_1896666 [Mycena leptocephala]|nr:hypothetical protein B0H13DRAFT_1896666 [Mycena leptocephala]
MSGAGIHAASSTTPLLDTRTECSTCARGVREFCGVGAMVYIRLACNVCVRKEAGGVHNRGRPAHIFTKELRRRSRALGVPLRLADARLCARITQRGDSLVGISACDGAGLLALCVCGSHLFLGARVDWIHASASRVRVWVNAKWAAVRTRQDVPVSRDTSASSRGARRPMRGGCSAAWKRLPYMVTTNGSSSPKGVADLVARRRWRRKWKWRPRRRRRDGEGRGETEVT